MHFTGQGIILYTEQYVIQLRVKTPIISLIQGHLMLYKPQNVIYSTLIQQKPAQQRLPGMSNRIHVSHHQLEKAQQNAVAKGSCSRLTRLHCHYKLHSCCILTTGGDDFPYLDLTCTWVVSVVGTDGGVD